MPDVKGSIKARLDAHAGLSALVSTRNWYAKAPQLPTFPFTVYMQISGVPYHAMGADLTNKSPRIQVTAYGSTPDSVIAVAEQVKAALQDYSGTSGGVAITRCMLENETDLPYEFEAKAYGIALEFTVHHS
jgi:hypothetical protein